MQVFVLRKKASLKKFININLTLSRKCQIFTSSKIIMIYFLFSLLLQTAPLLAVDDDFNSLLPELAAPLLEEPVPLLPVELDVLNGDNDPFTLQAESDLQQPFVPDYPLENDWPALPHYVNATDAIEPLPQTPATPLPQTPNALLDHPRLETEDEPPTKKAATNTEEGINLEQFIEHIMALMRESNPLLLPIGSPVKIMTTNPDYTYERQLLYLLFVVNYCLIINEYQAPTGYINSNPFFNNNNIQLPKNRTQHNLRTDTTITEAHIVALENTLTVYPTPRKKNPQLTLLITHISKIIYYFIREVACDSNSYFGADNQQELSCTLLDKSLPPEKRLGILKKARFYIKKHPTLTKWPSRSSSGCNPGISPFRKDDDQDPNGGNSHQGSFLNNHAPFLFSSAFLPIPTQSTATSPGQQRTATRHTVLQYLNNIVFTLLSVHVQQRNQLQNDLGCQPMVSAF